MFYMPYVRLHTDGEIKVGKRVYYLNRQMKKQICKYITSKTKQHDSVNTYSTQNSLLNWGH